MQRVFLGFAAGVMAGFRTAMMLDAALGQAALVSRAEPGVPGSYYRRQKGVKTMPWAYALLDGGVMSMFFALLEAAAGLLERQRWGKGGSNALPGASRAQTAWQRSARSKCLLTMVLLPLLYGAGRALQAGYPGFGLLLAAAYSQWLMIGLTHALLVKPLLASPAIDGCQRAGLPGVPAAWLLALCLMLALVQACLAWLPQAAG